MGVRQDIIASKESIKTKLNVSNEGILTVGYGGVYVSVEVVTDVNLSAPTADCEACGEEAAFVTSATLEKTTEEYLMPVMFDDEFGNTHPVVMGTDRGDSIRTIDATPTQGTLGEGTPDTG